MSAQVIDLASRRAPSASPAPDCGCTRHRVEALRERARDLSADIDGQLLVAAGPQAQLVRDVIDLAEFLMVPPEQRTNP